jgi:hypothetical protein
MWPRNSKLSVKRESVYSKNGRSVSESSRRSLKIKEEKEINNQNSDGIGQQRERKTMPNTNEMMTSKTRLSIEYDFDEKDKKIKEERKNSKILNNS